MRPRLATGLPFAVMGFTPSTSAGAPASVSRAPLFWTASIVIQPTALGGGPRAGPPTPGPNGQRTSRAAKEGVGGADTCREMALDPTLEEQELLADTRSREHSAMTRRELASGLVATVALLGVVAAMWVAAPVHDLDAGPLALATIVLIVASRVRFDTPLGFTVLTQLAFVPLLFAAPPPVVPVAVSLALGLARLPDVLRGETRPRGSLCLRATPGSRSAPRRSSRSPGAHPRTPASGCCSRRSPLSSPPTSSSRPSATATSAACRCARSCGRHGCTRSTPRCRVSRWSSPGTSSEPRSRWRCCRCSGCSRCSPASARSAWRACSSSTAPTAARRWCWATWSRPTTGTRASTARASSRSRSRSASGSA